MIKGFRFTNQLSNAEIDARIHQEFLNKNDGIFYGMELSKTSNSITVAEGLCEIAGRPVAVIGSETISVTTDSLYCLLILEIDLSKESTKDTFLQVAFKLLTSSTGYPTVTQQDINKYNGTNNIYQLEFARFKTGTNGITDFKDTRKFLNFSGIYAQIKADCEAVMQQIQDELENVEDGSAYLLKAHQLTNQDLNDYKTEGFYYGNSTNTVQNKPSNVGFFGLRVIKTADSLCTQQLVTNYNVYYRLCAGNGSWGDWKQVSLNGHTHDDRYYTETEANNKFKVKGDFAVVTGTIPANSTSTTISYPAGFNKNNCVVLSLMLTLNGKSAASCGSLLDTSQVINGDLPSSVILDNSAITVKAKCILISNGQTPITENSATAINFKLILMKT